MGSEYNSNNSGTRNMEEHLLLESLMNRLHVQQQQQHLDLDFDFDPLQDLLLLDEEEEEDEYDEEGEYRDRERRQLSIEESKLEKEIVKIIVSGNTHVLKPNSGQAVSVSVGQQHQNQHHICVGFHDEEDYRVWEWHGHIMLFDDDNGYTPEYIYGNYFERRGRGRPKNDDDTNNNNNFHKGGLRDLIQTHHSTNVRVLHQSRNAASPRVLKGTNGN